MVRAAVAKWGDRADEKQKTANRDIVGAGGNATSSATVSNVPNASVLSSAFGGSGGSGGPFGPGGGAGNANAQAKPVLLANKPRCRVSPEAATAALAMARALLALGAGQPPFRAAALARQSLAVRPPAVLLA